MKANLKTKAKKATANKYAKKGVNAMSKGKKSAC